MNIYADTNFITRLYLERPETNVAENRMRDEQPCLPVTWLLRLETINSFEQAVLTGFGESQNRICANLTASCQQQFRDDLRHGIVMKRVEVRQTELERLFEEISLRYTAKHGFRTYDILHVASALLLKCRSFWSFDKRACKLAKLEGLKLI
ncbi:MAG: type II toxin-antitoxin system VapC family toxin [Verrucomicrobiaceae bacterium]|nr:type II toxin-antitoxin system VapC family toxin [Verrucomicrobiaceae bacterium]